jgi:hypothetical protein
MADLLLAQDYTSFDGEVASKGMLKSSKKCTMACLVALAFGALAGTMTGRVVWARPEANVNLDSQPVAETMNMADPSAMKQLAESLKAAALGQNITLSSEAQAAIAKQMKELLANPRVVEEVQRAIAQLRATVADPAFQEEKTRLVEQIRPLLANVHADVDADVQESRGRRLSSLSPTSHLSRFRQPAPVMAKRDVSMAASGVPDSPWKPFPTPTAPEPKIRTVPLLKKLGDMKLATTVSKLGVLSSAEKGKFFSKLEKAKGFSTAESLLPLADKLGALQFLGDAIDAGSGDIALRGAALLAVGPLYAALAGQGIVPPVDTEFPAVLAPGLLFTATTGGGVLLLVLGNLASQVEGVGDPLTLKRNRPQLLRKLGEKKVATAISELGLLSAAEKANVFSKLEKDGLYSTAESLLPLADDLKIPQFLQGIIDSRPEDLYTTGGVFLILAPLGALISLGPIGLATGDIIPQGINVLIPLTIAALPGAFGLAYIAAAIGVDKLKEE